LATIRQTIINSGILTKTELKVYCLRPPFVSGMAVKFVPDVFIIAVRNGINKKGMSKKSITPSLRLRGVARYEAKQEAIRNTVNHRIASGCALRVTGLDPFETPPASAAI
jgi:hypothetical protein